MGLNLLNCPLTHLKLKFRSYFWFKSIFKKIKKYCIEKINDDEEK
jgi:hypothetical protein